MIYSQESEFNPLAVEQPRLPPDVEPLLDTREGEEGVQTLVTIALGVTLLVVALIGFAEQVGWLP